MAEARPVSLDEAMASALAEASAAGRWDVVAQLARELEARRLASSSEPPRRPVSERHRRLARAALQRVGLLPAKAREVSR